MNKPAMTVVEGEPFVFVCYSHADAEPVYADLDRLAEQGVRFWYDEGIPAGTSWRGEIAAAIESASRFIFFVSTASLGSAHCIREVEYALDHDIPIVPVYLEPCTLPAELGLALNRVQALFRHSDPRYPEHLQAAVRDGAGRAAGPLTGRSSGRRVRFAWGAALVAIILIVTWLTWRTIEPGAGTLPEPAPHAHEQYLEGIDLVARWDQNDNLQQAIGKFEQATVLDPDFALAHARLGDAFRLQSVLTGEKSLLDRALEEASLAERLNPDLAPVQVALGRIHDALGNEDLAFAALERAISIDPNDASANQSIAKLYERQGRLETAEVSFRKALSLAPDDLLIRDSYANFLYRQSRSEEAAEQWRSIIEQAPDHFGALVNLGSALNAMGDIPGAIAMYERAISVRPNYTAYSSLGAAYWRAGQYAEAVTAIQKALEIDDTDWLPWGNLGYAYASMGSESQKASEAFAKAISLAEAARQQHPRDPYVHSDLGLYYAKTGQSEPALQRMDTALTLSPDSGEILAAASETLELLGQRDRAVELAKQTLAQGFPLKRFQSNPEMSGLLQDPRLRDVL